MSLACESASEARLRCRSTAEPQPTGAAPAKIILDVEAAFQTLKYSARTRSRPCSRRITRRPHRLPLRHIALSAVVIGFLRSWIARKRPIWHSLARGVIAASKPGPRTLPSSSKSCGSIEPALCLISWLPGQARPSDPTICTPAPPQLRTPSHPQASFAESLDQDLILQSLSRLALLHQAGRRASGLLRPTHFDLPSTIPTSIEAHSLPCMHPRCRQNTYRRALRKSRPDAPSKTEPLNPRAARAPPTLHLDTVLDLQRFQPSPPSHPPPRVLTSDYSPHRSSVLERPQRRMPGQTGHPSRTIPRRMTRHLSIHSLPQERLGPVQAAPLINLQVVLFRSPRLRTSPRAQPSDRRLNNAQRTQSLASAQLRRNKLLNLTRLS